VAQSDDPGLDRPMTRRAFVRGSAVSIGALAAGSALTSSRPAHAAAPAAADALPPYVGAGSNAPVRPFPLYQVALGDGLFKEKRERILKFARAYDQRRYLVLFNNVAGRPNPPGVSVPGGWEDGGLLSGHWTGHFMSMLAQAHISTGEPIFTDKLFWMVDELGACQDALAGTTVHPGYVGAKPEDVVLRQGPPRFAVYGGDQNTNTWAPWYVQHKIMRGLLDTYYLTGDARAFDIVEKMANWAHLALTLGDVNHPNYTGPVTRDDLNFMWDTYIAGEFGGANEVFPEIYALTGDARHLETAKAFDSRESLFNACVQNRDILVCAPGTQPGRRRPPRLHANTHVPNFTGYLRIYEQTGEGDYFRAAKNFRGMIIPHRMFAHGGTSGNYPGSNNNVEQLQNRDNIASAIANDGAETCTTYNLLKLTRNLFFHEQDPAYMDYYERGLFNQIAGSRADNDRTSNPQLTYFQPLTPGRGRSYGNTGTCCGGTGLENHTKYQESIYFRSADDSTLWVNLFVSSTLDWAEKGLTITQETDFPREQGTKLTVGGTCPLAIKLRVPAWARSGYVVRVNGAVQDLVAKPGNYVTLSRGWRSGDTIEVSMPFSIRIERARDRPDTQSIFYGPVLLPILGDPGGGSYRELTLYRHLKRDGDYARAAIVSTGGNTFRSNGFALRPHYIGDDQPHSPYFRRVEPQIVFGSIDSGVPNRKRDDDLPSYDVPVTGIPSPGDDGLTFLDIVWDQAPFATHGAFVSTVARAAEGFVAAGLFSAEEKDLVVSAAGRAERDLEP
jgi:DUF1680 family protein